MELHAVVEKTLNLNQIQPRPGAGVREVEDGDLASFVIEKRAHRLGHEARANTRTSQDSTDGPLWLLGHAIQQQRSSDGIFAIGPLRVACLHRRARRRTSGPKNRRRPTGIRYVETRFRQEAAIVLGKLPFSHEFSKA